MILKKLKLFYRCKILPLFYKEVLLVDVGGHQGQSVKNMRRMFQFLRKYPVITFEPNPEYTKYYENIDDHILMPYAAWIYHGDTEFYLQNIDHHNPDGSGQGHSLMEKKNNVGEKSIKVKCMDFSEWLSARREYLIVKIDIEGAEYEVLQKMLDNRIVDKIGQLYVEFHNKKHGLVPQEVEDNLIKELQKRTKLYYWT